MSIFVLVTLSDTSAHATASACKILHSVECVMDWKIYVLERKITSLGRWLFVAVIVGDREGSKVVKSINFKVPRQLGFDKSTR